MAPMFCPNCGKQLVLTGQKFCAHCGGDLNILAEDAQPAASSASVAVPEPGSVIPSLVGAGSMRTPASIPTPARVNNPEEPSTQSSSQARPEPAPASQPKPSPATSSAPSAAAAVGLAGRSWRRPLLVLAGIVLVLAIASLGYLVVGRSNPSSSPQAGLGLASASLDPDAPAFPVPTGSTLLNDSMEGSGTAAYRLVAWQSGADYATTAAFYSGLKDARWHGDGSSTTTPQATDISFSDGSSVFGKADVEVSQTDPVTIDVRFLPAAGPPAKSFAPGPTIAFGALPSASSLPAGFPSALVPPGSTLIDSGAIGSTDFALFSGSIDLTTYETQIATVAKITGTQIDSGATVIDFTIGGKAGQIVVDLASDQISVEVTQ